MNTEQFDEHTPGPWWIEEVSDNGNKDTWLMGNFPHNYMLFCMEWTEGNDIDLRLIADAPLLLQEFKRLRERHVAFMQWMIEHYDEIVNEWEASE